MTITSADLKFFAAAYPDDTATGGGPMTANVVQTGTENNVFPDIDPPARAAGRVQLRKVFLAVTSTTVDTLMAAQAGFTAGSSDASVDIVAFAFGGADTLRPAALDALQSAPHLWGFAATGNGVTLTYALVPGQPNQIAMNAGQPVPAVGALVTFGQFYTLSLGNSENVVPEIVTWVTAVSGATVTLADPVPTAQTFYFYTTPQVSSKSAKAIGAAVLTASSTPTSARVSRVLARVVPDFAAYPSAVTGLSDTSALRAYRGRVPIFRPGDLVVLRNGSTTEVASVAAVDFTGGLTFAAALANNFPTGSVISALASFGDLRGTVGPSFTQQTWTRSWSDAILGNPIGLAYDTIAGSITTTNIGAETKRWAIVFTSPTAFNLLGEDLGQIATGSTTAVFAPLNPITGAPYFTIAAAGWGSGWGLGNVLRFNTTGARAPVWLARCVSPSAAGSVNTPSLEVRGSVNA